jgi:hypothetical protein
MKKNKNIFIILIILLIGGALVFKILPSNNKNNHNENEKYNHNENKEISEDFVYTNAFCIKRIKNSLSLVAIDTHNTQRRIYNFDDYDGDVEDVKYYFDKVQSKIYLFIKNYKYDNQGEKHLKIDVALIDISAEDQKFEKSNDNHKIDIFSEIDVENNEFNITNVNSITKLGNNIYFSNSELYKMNLDDYKIEKMNIVSEGYQMKVLNYNNTMLVYNSGKDIYTLNTSNNNKEKIVENGMPGYIYGNEIIYIDYADVKQIYKSYNMDNKEVKQISDDVKNGSVEFEYAIPYGESYLSLIGNTFFYNNGNNKFELSCNNINTQYCKSFDIVSYIVYSDHIDVTGYLNQGIDDANIEHNYANIVVDLQKQEVYSPEYTEELNEYIYVTYIK